ncbi:MAG TPA: ubiquinol-cytochrome C chaperone family protein [Methyloceanibacter sp.]|nr:ubiquinol-cytochrome C chaperone family protein [Methyloceanibacter sp.]
MTPLDPLMRWRSEASTTEKLYGAIVAQTRLPVFYRSFGVSDTLEGRFALLALHLFAVLHRLKTEGSEGCALAQDLVDRFSQDMETVLRELGVSDLRVPQSMRRLAAASKGLFEDYETALAAGQVSLAHAIAASLPGETESAKVSSKALASYLLASTEALDRQDIVSLRAGVADFAEASVKP